MFPLLKNKKFLDVSSGRVVSIIDQFENIAILDDRSRIDVNRLLDKNFYDEYIDPKNFFNQQNYQVFTEKIKSIPNEVLEKMDDFNQNESLILESDPEEEKRKLMEKAKLMNSSNEFQNQMDKFKDYIDEEIPFVPPTQIREIDSTVQVAQPVPNPTPLIKEDPMITMFKNAKRNTEIKISFDLLDKIPKPEFIELMEDSYEVSIINFLSDEFTKKILGDPSIIKEKVKSEIERIVYKKKLEKKESTSIREDKNKESKAVVKKRGATSSSSKTVRQKRSIPPPSTPPDRSLKDVKDPNKPNLVI